MSVTTQTHRATTRPGETAQYSDFYFANLFWRNIDPAIAAHFKQEELDFDEGILMDPIENKWSGRPEGRLVGELKNKDYRLSLKDSRAETAEVLEKDAYVLNFQLLDDKLVGKLNHSLTEGEGQRQKLKSDINTYFQTLRTKNKKILSEWIDTPEKRGAKRKARKKMRGQISKLKGEIQDFNKKLRKDFLKSYKTTKKVQDKIFSLEKAARTDVYTLLNDEFRAAVNAGRTPDVIFSYESDAAGILANSVLGTMQSEIDQLTNYGEIPLGNKKLMVKALEKEKKVKWKAVVPAVIFGLGAAAVAWWVTWRRMMLAQGVYDGAQAEVQRVQGIMDLAEQELGDEYSGTGGRLRLLAEISAGRHEDLVAQYDTYMAEFMAVADIDGDGLIDYEEDWDLDNDGEIDMDPDTLNTLDPDAPVNEEALSRYLFEDMGITTDPLINEKYGDWLVAHAKYEAAMEIMDTIDNLFIDSDGDGKADYKLKKVDGEWVPDTENGDWDLDNDGVTDITFVEDGDGKVIWQINDQDSMAMYTTYSDEVQTAFEQVQADLQGTYVTWNELGLEKMDMDGDGLLDYIEDWDLDNDGEIDMDPDTLNTLDPDAPVNEYALARYLYEDMGITSDEYINRYYAQYEAALEQYNLANDFNIESQNVVNDLSEIATYQQVLAGHLNEIQRLHGLQKEYQLDLSEAMAEVPVAEKALNAATQLTKGAYAFFAVGPAMTAYAANRVASSFKSIKYLPYLIESKGRFQTAQIST
ncbi:MAG: hypothetical protein GOV00_01290 [Candidatus Altiarchaeota archaeon]|nr:hypothetical protein [Candidatus Altiarchaeota archaeon]